MHTQIHTHEKSTLHYVCANLKERATFAKLCMSIGYHCELYDDLSELAAYPPRHGVIVLHDSPSLGSLGAAIEWLEDLGIWLAVIAIGDTPNPSAIVDAIKSGALDYLAAPIEEERLERSLARTSKEAARTSNLRRRRVEANERLSRLSSREAEVLDLLTEGLTNKQIARELEISPRTVEIHRANMMSKIGETHAAGAVRIKLQAGGAA
ncbi:MAG: LuxR C-terminal-related transcriptional regulator [Parvularcula sp.]|nr:LuxR C-terminal-related transcriptional regulator [Parvularcula sp.]